MAPARYDSPQPYDRSLVQYDSPPASASLYDGVAAYGAPAYDSSSTYDGQVVPAGYFDTALPYDHPGFFDEQELV